MSQGPIDALDYSGPGRDEKIGTATRWYLGLLQLMLRDIGRSASRRHAAIKSRRNAFLNGDYTALAQRWWKDYDKAVSRKRTTRPETRDYRLSH